MIFLALLNPVVFARRTFAPSEVTTCSQLKTHTDNQQDPRQYVPASGQLWTSLSLEKSKQKNNFEQDTLDPRIWFITTEPKARLPVPVPNPPTRLPTNHISKTAWHRRTLHTPENALRKHPLGPHLLHRRRHRRLHKFPGRAKGHRDLAPALLHHASGMGAHLLLSRIHLKSRRRMA